MRRREIAAYITLARAALYAGDNALADWQLAALEKKLVSRRYSIVCSKCGLEFDWPGELAAHTQQRHPAS